MAARMKDASRPAYRARSEPGESASRSELITAARFPRVSSAAAAARAGGLALSTEYREQQIPTKHFVAS